MIDKATLFADLKYRPHSGQIPIHASRARRRVCATGVRFGKTTIAAYEAIAWSLAPYDRAVGWVVAPTYELSTRVFREIAHVFMTKLRPFVVKYSEHEHLIVVRNLMPGGRCEIRGKSADAPVSLLGEGLNWLVVDEFARIKPDVWERHLSQRLVDKDGEALLISTPRGKGLFYSLFQRGQRGVDPHYESWNMPSWDNPLLKRELIEAERARLPEAVFAQEFGGAWVEGAGQVFRNVRDLATGELEEPRADETYYAGLDLAQVQDYTVLVVLDSRCRVVYVDRFHRIDWSLQVARIKAATERYGDCAVLVDSTGVGEPVYEALRAADVYAEGYHLSASSKDALVNNLAMMLERGEVTLPRPELCPELVDELEAFQYSVTDMGNVRTGAPSGYHDDCVIALALGAWKASRRCFYSDDPLGY